MWRNYEEIIVENQRRWFGIGNQLACSMRLTPESLPA
jgi:hypothetical protein